MQILPLGTNFFLGDGQTDMKILTVAFRNCVNAPEKYKQKHNLYVISLQTDGLGSQFIFTRGKLSYLVE